tara:strand:+ start:280 stop:504 length:225 start_codon:yes stop_codon:yes gene_type:complete
MSIFTKFIISIFFLIKRKINVKAKIIINSPLDKISKPEVIEKKIIFFFVLIFINANNNFKNNNERKSCMFADVI